MRRCEEVPGEEDAHKTTDFPALGETTMGPVAGADAKFVSCQFGYVINQCNKLDILVERISLRWCLPRGDSVPRSFDCLRRKMTFLLSVGPLLS